jgi:hypothetical protein
VIVERVHGLNRAISGLQRQLLEALVQLEDMEIWQDDGAYSMTHWIGQQIGISGWKAERWLSSGRALRALPATAEAFSSGEIGIDKVVELTRFATREDEDVLARWAKDVASGAIRRRAELLARGEGVAVGDASIRSVDWRYVDQGTRMHIWGDLPAAQGSVVASAIDRLTEQVPPMPNDHPVYSLHERRADALVALCSAHLSEDADQDRATVIVHTDLEPLLDPEAKASVEGGGVIHGDALQRLLCNARVQTVIEHPDGSVAGVGRMSREPSAWMMRQLRHRDDTCRFPGCGARRFTQAHHIRWWSKGGRTELDNLILVCTFHHRLVHEHGWSIRREDDGEIAWFRPGDVRYRAGPNAA